MKSKITILLLLLAVSTKLAAQTGHLTGKVTDELGRKLVSLITLADSGKIKYTTLTNTEGVYTFTNLRAATYVVNASCLNYGTKTKRNVVISDGKKEIINFRLKQNSPVIKEEETVYAPPPAATSGRAYSKADGQTAKYIRESPGHSYYQAPVEYKQKPQFYNPSIESYKKNSENDFMNVKVNPMSTMSVDVDRASYSNIRRFINQGQLPPADAVRVEEMINYFDYDYAQPKGEDPISINTEITNCPWQSGHKILRIGMQARKVNMDRLPASNLVFLIDVSGSMESQERLPLLVEGMKLLVQNLRSIDKVAIVTYAGNAGLVLPSTSGNHKQTILDALEKLHAGGSTAGGAGIKLAYKVASENYIKGGNNRVMLATDGDFNVGASNENDLETLIVRQRESGIFLTCLGFGTGNYKDSKMELLADKGNGNYDYIDNVQEAQKTLVSEFGGTLFTIAKDVKSQIEFNPSKVQGYRLIGYENRLLNNEDFKDDKKDAGDMGSGHVVTILYEIIPKGFNSEYMREANELKYQRPAKTEATYSNEFATIKFRYKKPDENHSKEMVHIIPDNTNSIASASENTRFATSVAMFGMLLTHSKYKGTCSYNDVITMASGSRSIDKEGYRAEFIRLVKAAKEYKPTAAIE